MNDPIARHESIVAQHPGNELARFSLAKALFDAGRFADASPHFQFCVGRQPDWMAAQILAGKCAQALENFAGARESFERARQLALDQHHEGPQAELEELLRALS